MSKKKQVEIMVVTFEQYQQIDFIFPSKYMFRDCLGNYVFVLTSKREIAEKFVKDEYNGMYNIRVV